MSGIVGLIHLDGTPVDRQLLEEMTAFLRFRGPDAQDIRAEGCVGFAHTLLKTTFESEREHQPCSLDGQVWITADARIDGQADLIEQLRTNGRTGLDAATDAELILHAYHAWSENCLQHLIGDFSFAIWDGPQQKLFCARDHFGVKPFFHALVGHVLVFSNTLDCIRKHPAVSDTLSDLWIADFLLFERSLEPTATVYADIQRLPPSHSLTWSAAEGRGIKRYWSLPTDLGIRHRPAGDYVEHFRMLLEQAVADRLRTDRVGVEMSGGMDSTAVAAVANELLSRQGRPFELHAHTVVYDRLIPDQERRYAGKAAEKLGIPIHYLVADDYTLYERCDDPEMHQPEPWHNPELALHADFKKQAAAYSRVVLTGWDGDALLQEAPLTYLRALFYRRQYGRLVLEAARLCLTRPGQVAHGLWKRLRSRTPAPTMDSQAYPTWISPELEERLDLRQRWDRYHRTAGISHPLRPYAYLSYGNVLHLPHFFDSQDAGLTGQALEYRHPLFDLRLVEYCLSLPPLPWCIRKEILRTAMQGALPLSVLRRPKSPLAGLPYVERLQMAETRWLDDIAAEAKLYNSLNMGKLPRVWSRQDPLETWVNLRPLSLNFWLRSARISIR